MFFSSYINAIGNYIELLQRISHNIIISHSDFFIHGKGNNTLKGLLQGIRNAAGTRKNMIIQFLQLCKLMLLPPNTCNELHGNTYSNGQKNMYDGTGQ